MKWLCISLETFKKVREPHGFPFMPVNAFAYNNNNPPLIKNQYIPSHIGGLICLSTLLQHEKKKRGYFGKQ